MKPELYMWASMLVCVCMCVCTQVDLCAQALPRTSIRVLFKTLTDWFEEQKHTNYPHTGLKGLWEQLLGCNLRVREGTSNSGRHENAK